MSEELKPCPFCGDTPVSGYGGQVVCQNCWADAPLVSWNKRTPDWRALAQEAGKFLAISDIVCEYGCPHAFNGGCDWENNGKPLATCRMIRGRDDVLNKLKEAGLEV